VAIRRVKLALTGALAGASLAVSPAWGCASDYSYAGLANSAAGHGVRATLTATARPDVEWGHVAGWVGVGGPGLGPNGEDAWIQVGLSGFPGSTSKLYFEVTEPGSPPRYTELDAEVAVGESRRLAVLEMVSRPDWWRVWVDGVPVSQPVYLPGSHGKWMPIATAESWNGGRESCNRFQYRFDRVMVARAPGGDWYALSPGQTFEDQGYRLSRDTAGFVASGA
jgi:hypothetical protein